MTGKTSAEDIIYDAVDMRHQLFHEGRISGAAYAKSIVDALNAAGYRIVPAYLDITQEAPRVD